jgi:hypothetical protein
MMRTIIVAVLAHIRRSELSGSGASGSSLLHGRKGHTAQANTRIDVLWMYASFGRSCFCTKDTTLQGTLQGIFAGHKEGSSRVSRKGS